MPDLLFEIGTEELPPSLIDSFISQIKGNITKDLEANYISIAQENIQTYSTPRRLAVLIQDLPETQPEKTLELKGPPKNKAFDTNGKPTQVAIGFAKKANTAIEELITKNINGADYIFAKTKTGGQETKVLLATILLDSIKNTTGDKFMKWGNTNEKFARPIRWIVAILDKEIIQFEYAGIKSSNTSYGHRFLSTKEIKIEAPKKYKEQLKNEYVIVDQEERKEKIKALITQATNSHKAKLTDTCKPLLDTVTNITEYPELLTCSFEDEFLKLPSIIVETVLEKHQKYFVLKDKTNGKLLPAFLVITNGTKAKEQIQKGNEKVARARLNDAQFFFQEDLRTSFSFAILSEKLAKITFQKGLGNMKEKVDRITKLSQLIYDTVKEQIKCTKEHIITTAQLAKLDLTTQLVFEFTELQGVIGSIYSQENQYDEVVYQGIQEHYYPRFYGDKIPESATGLIVGLADKLDNLICLFTLGKIPSGSADPFALRRQAQGVIENILAKNISVDIEALIQKHIELNLDKKIKEKTSENTNKQIQDFLIQRFITVMENTGFEQDLVNAVVTNKSPLRDIILAKDNIQRAKKSSENTEFLRAAKRLVRIVDSKANGNIELSHLKTEHERKLLNIFNEINNKKYKNTDDMLVDFFMLTDPINQFFDNVLVNDPDPKIKQTRQSLLKKGKDLFERICDFNKIVERS